MTRKQLTPFEETAILLGALAVDEEFQDVLGGVYRVISQAFRLGNKLLLMGNGGSAADAQHIAAEFVNKFLIDRDPLPAVALTTDTSVITSISNDYSFEDIFVRQIRALGVPGDVLLGYTTSGSSVNVIRGLEIAKQRGLTTVCLTGQFTDQLSAFSDYVLSVPSSSTPRIQECHLVIGHTLSELVEADIFGSTP